MAKAVDQKTMTLQYFTLRRIGDGAHGSFSHGVHEQDENL
jgi:hypothetical protein